MASELLMTLHIDVRVFCLVVYEKRIDVSKKTHCINLRDRMRRPANFCGCSQLIHKIRLQPLTSANFLIRYSVTSLTFDVVWPQCSDGVVIEGTGLTVNKAQCHGR